MPQSMKTLCFQDSGSPIITDSGILGNKLSRKKSTFFLSKEINICHNVIIKLFPYEIPWWIRFFCCAVGIIQSVKKCTAWAPLV